MKYIISLLISFFIHFTTFSFESNSLNVPDTSFNKKDWYIASGIEGSFYLIGLYYSPANFGYNLDYTINENTLSFRAKKGSRNWYQINSFYYGLQYTRLFSKDNDYGIGLGIYNFYDFKNYLILALELNKKYIWDHYQIKLFMALNNFIMEPDYSNREQGLGKTFRKYNLELGMQIQLKY